MYTDVELFQVKLKLMCNQLDQQIFYNFSCCKSAIEYFFKSSQRDLIKTKFIIPLNNSKTNFQQDLMIFVRLIKK